MSVSGNQGRGILIAGSAVSAIATGSSVSTSWVQVIASTSTTIYITGISVCAGNNTASGTVYIGTGGAGSEVTVFSFLASAGGNTYYGGMSMALVYPIRVPAGTRVAVSKSTGNNFEVGITYVNESAVV